MTRKHSVDWGMHAAVVTSPEWMANLFACHQSCLPSAVEESAAGLVLVSRLDQWGQPLVRALRWFLGGVRRRNHLCEMAWIAIREVANSNGKSAFDRKAVVDAHD